MDRGVQGVDRLRGYFFKFWSDSYPFFPVYYVYYVSKIGKLQIFEKKHRLSELNQISAMNLIIRDQNSGIEILEN